MPKQRMTEREKQIFAVAVQWGLVRAVASANSRGRMQFAGLGHHPSGGIGRRTCCVRFAFFRLVIDALIDHVKRLEE